MSAYTERLTKPEQVIQIRERYARKDGSCAVLGREYGLSRAAVWWIVSGGTHRHVGGPITKEGDTHKKRTLVRRRPSKYTDEQIIRVREMVVNGGHSEAEAATETGISPTHVSSIVRGLSRRNVGGPILDEDRYRRGEQVSRSVLTTLGVQDILWHGLVKQDVTQSDLARRHHISRGMVGHIVHRRKWAHVPIPTEAVEE